MSLQPSELRAGDVIARSGANGERLLLRVREIEPDAGLVLALDPTSGETEWLLDLDGFELLSVGERGSEDISTASTLQSLPSSSTSAAGHQSTVATGPSPPAAVAPPTMAVAIRIPGCDTEVRVLKAAAEDAETVRRGDLVAVQATAFVVVPGSGGGVNLRKCWSTHDWQPGQPRGPFEYTVGSGAVVKGFECGLIGAGVGEVRELRVPTREAYGAAGCTAWDIPRDADLHFEIEVRA
jgi:hypothetical protein